MSSYLDDWIIITYFKTQVAQHTKLILKKLESLRWINNFKKPIRKPPSISRTTRFLIEYSNHDCTAPWQKIARPTSQHTANSQKASTISTHYTQSYNAHSCSHFCTNVSPLVYTTPLVVKEPNCQILCRLKQTPTITNRMLLRTHVVLKQCLPLEWEEHLITNAAENCLCQCQQHRMEISFTGSCQQAINYIWTLVKSRGPNVNQLAQTQDRISCPPGFSPYEEYTYSYSHRQYYLDGLHEQIG